MAADEISTSNFKAIRLQIGLIVMRGAAPAFVVPLLLLTAVSSESRACDGDTVLLNEDFSFADASWGQQSDSFAIKDGAAIIRPEPGHGYKALDNAFLFADADICLGVTALEVGKPEESAGGLVFWAQDYKNAFFLTIATNGYFKIGRMINGGWVNPPLDWTQSDLIAQGVMRPNKLRLTIAGQTLAVAINDRPAIKLRAQSPGPSSLIGLYAESGQTAADSWKFNDLQVTTLK
jgi:hypothetical protein